MILQSLIIPCYNQKDKIAKLIASLERQTLNKDLFEVIIAECGSVDGSGKFIQEYNGNLNIIPVLLESPSSRAKARNAAIKKAKGKVVFFLDGDMIAHENLLKCHADAQSASENCVYVGKVEPYKNHRKSAFSWYRTTRGAQKIKTKKCLPAKYFTTNNASVPTALLKKSGSFNEAYLAWGGEDQEMGYRLKNQGTRLYFLSTALSYHDHFENLDDYTKKIINYAKTGLRILIKNCPEHAERGYLYYFSKKSGIIKFFLNIFFLRIIYFFVLSFINFMQCRPLAFYMYDYITYYHIYHHLRE